VCLLLANSQYQQTATSGREWKAAAASWRGQSDTILVRKSNADMGHNTLECTQPGSNLFAYPMWVFMKFRAAGRINTL